MRTPSTIQAAAPADESDSIEITVQGRKAWVFRRKRAGERSRFYFVKGRLQNGEQFYRSTASASEREAVKIGKALFAAALKGEVAKLLTWQQRAPARAATLGEIIKAHELGIARANVTLQPETAAGYRNALRRLVAWAKGWHLESSRGGGERRHADARRVDAAPSSILTPELKDDFVANYVAAAGSSPIRRAQALRSAHTVLRNACALFDRDGLKCFAALTLPERLDTFLQHQVPEAPAVEHTVLSDTAVAEMAAAAARLRETEPGLYLVHLLCRHCGVRNDELLHMRVEWFEVQTPARVLRIADGSERQAAAVLAIVQRHYFDPKGSSGRIAIAPCVWAELQTWILNREKLDHVVPGETERERRQLIYRRHADFVRPWTRDHQKKGYELRRWGATRVATMHQSDDMAEKFLRHARRSVAAKHYVPADTVMPAPITVADCLGAGAGA